MKASISEIFEHAKHHTPDENCSICCEQIEEADRASQFVQLIVDRKNGELEYALDRVGRIWKWDAIEDEWYLSIAFNRKNVRG